MRLLLQPREVSGAAQHRVVEGATHEATDTERPLAVVHDRIGGRPCVGLRISAGLQSSDGFNERHVFPHLGHLCTVLAVRHVGPDRCEPILAKHGCLTALGSLRDQRTAAVRRSKTCRMLETAHA